MSRIELTLTSGKKIWAATIHGELTRSLSFESVPHREGNDRFLAALPARVRKLFNAPMIPVHIVEPERKIEPPPVPHWPWGPLENLPAYWYAAEFYDDRMATCLAVVWFQDEQLPIPSDEARARLEAIDWEGYAEAFNP